MGANKVAAALCANPFASGGEVLATIKVGLGGLGVVGVGQGCENGGLRRREAGVMRSGRICGAQLGHVAHRTAPRLVAGMAAEGNQYLPEGGGGEVRGGEGPEGRGEFL